MGLRSSGAAPLRQQEDKIRHDVHDAAATLPRRVWRGLGTLALAALLPLSAAACGGASSIVEDGIEATARDGIQDAADEAIAGAIESRMEDWVAGFTEPMLLQLAYTQVLHMGGFGVAVDDFQEGEGTVWELRMVDAEGEEGPPVRGERALLERMDDGTDWWYLRYETPEQDPLEFEVRMDAAFQASEMYIRDVETGEVRHHEFDLDPSEQEERQASDAELDEAGLHTDYVHVDDWGEYRQEQVSVQVAAGTYDAELLVFTPPEHEGDFELRWWVNPELPGNLVRYHHEDFETGGELTGELVEHRSDYVRTLGN